MKCQRCEGFMIEDHLLDMAESFESMWLRAWRCLNCGHAVDATMVANRQKPVRLRPAPVGHEETVAEPDRAIPVTVAA
jgi:hypothetical protein